MGYIEKLKQCTKSSSLVVGLDVDIKKIPDVFFQYENPALEFNKIIIDATIDNCAGYKLNLAFYEFLGKDFWTALNGTVEYIGGKRITICDGKRGDIGNTGEMYARIYLDDIGFDAITVNPYMGMDSLIPFLERQSKFVYILALTSNKGAEDFEKLRVKDSLGKEKFLFEIVIEKIISSEYRNAGFVFGADRDVEINKYTSVEYNLPLLIPGVGAQGGDIDKLKGSLNNNLCLINSSRKIIYSGNKNSSIDEVIYKTKESLSSLNELLKL